MSITHADRSGRRRFLGLALGAGGLAALGAVPGARRLLGGGVAPEAPSGLHRAERTSKALGSDVSMTALHADRTTAEQAVSEAFAELELVEEIMSLYRPHSQVSRLNRDGVLTSPHPYLIAVLRKAREMSERTAGGFDVTVQPLWRIYADAKKKGTTPEAGQVVRARMLVDWRRMEISEDRIRLGHGMSITLNGIAQGFAADRAQAALRNRGIRHALVNTGEIAALGRKESGARWKVGVQHPRREDAFVRLAELEGRFMATSGDYATTFTGDYRHHHILDPGTGQSPVELASVTVLAADGMTADALSTAVFVQGAERGLELVAATPGADALFVLKGGSSFSTAGFPEA